MPQDKAHLITSKRTTIRKKLANFMVRLKNIIKLDKNVICDAYVEDCEIPIKLDLNINTKTMNDVIFPVGYEYCMSHIAHAKWKIIEMIENNQFPDNLTIMWY